MKHIIMFPSDYFNIKQVDETYLPEYNEVCKHPDFAVLFYNHDKFVNEGVLRFYPKLDDLDGGICIGRTWMMKPEEYTILYNELLQNGIKLINSPDEYNNMHLFPLIYQAINDFTPKTLYYAGVNDINVDLINSTFSRFMNKDYVKSVKEQDYPKFFETPISQDELKKQVDRFVELRGALFTGGIVFKEFLDLKKYGSATNEYRAFYLFGEILSISRNSNQPDSCPFVQQDFAEKFKALRSDYYTVDFAELEDGRFIVLETGDGQVSGLSPNQYVFKYYDDMRAII